MTQEAINEFAQQARACGTTKTPFKWRGYDVYIADYHGMPAPPMGQPFVFLVRGEEIKVSSPEVANCITREHRRWFYERQEE